MIFSTHRVGGLFACAGPEPVRGLLAGAADSGAGSGAANPYTANRSANPRHVPKRT